MIMGLALNVTIAVLLLVTIGYCWRLNKRIQELRHGRHEMNQFIADFNNAIQRAEWNIHELKRVSQDADETLRVQLDKGRFLANDLSFLLDKGETVADVLEQYIKHSRALQHSMRDEIQQQPRRATDIYPNHDIPYTPRNPATTPPRQHNATGISHQPTKPASQPRHESSTKPTGMSPTKRQALETLLEQIADRKAKAHQPGNLGLTQPVLPLTATARNNQPSDAEQTPPPPRTRHNIET